MGIRSWELSRRCGSSGGNPVGDGSETGAEGCMPPQYLLSHYSYLNHRGVGLWLLRYI